MKNLNRRELFETAALLTAINALGQLTLLPASYAQQAAATATRLPHFFLMFSVQGGMDVTLGLEPRRHSVDGTTQEDVFLEYREDEIISNKRILLGPAAASLKPFASRMAIINGISMRRDAGHDALRAYIESGAGDGQSAVLAAEIAQAKSNAPLGIIFNNSINVGQRRVIVTRTSDLNSNDLQNSFPLMNEVAKNSKGQHLEAMRGFLKSEKPLNSFNELKKNFPDLDPNSQETAVTLSGLAFASGLSEQAYISLINRSGNMDSHSNHQQQHMTAQKDIWDQVATAVKTLSSIQYGTTGKSIMDLTTIMVTTEFSRTPALNGANGKDHNPYTNSVALIGKGINGGTVAGSSRIIKKAKSPLDIALNVARPIDFATGQSLSARDQLNSTSGLIFPENVARTVAKIFGDPKKFESVDLDKVLPVPGIARV